MSFIEVRNLKYRYPRTEKLALDGLGFNVEKGEFIGILGKNKAGKSTLCQAFMGLVPGMFGGAYGGQVMIDGMEASSTPGAYTFVYTCIRTLQEGRTGVPESL